ncbi:MAG: PIG-L deacetylase family protein [Promethearchaeota archaeon]
MSDTPSQPLEESPRHLLVIGAHADDETFGCGGTISQETRRGAKVTVCCLTSTSDREEELRAACKLLGAEVVVDEGSDFSLTVPKTTKRLISLIQDCKPEVIISHSALDYHPDHRVVHQAVLQAAEWAGHITLDSEQAWRIRRLLCMEINNLIPMPTLFINISEVIDIKRQAIIAYRSQMKKTEGYYMSFNLQKAQLRGIQASCEFAEAYQEIPLPVHGPFYSPSTTRQTVFP